MGLQNIVEEQLEYAVNKYSPEKIMAVFINPETGEILAMASRPHFNQFTRDGVRKYTLYRIAMNQVQHSKLFH